MNKPMVIVVAPSGAGKSSFVERITREIPTLHDTVTYTTRSMRKGESEGHPYHFITETDFRNRLVREFFVEHAVVHGNLYGTSYEDIEKAWEAGKAVIMDVDFQGARTFKSKFPWAQTVFIMPPSIEELRKRIIGRDGKIPHDLELRLETAKKEIELAPEFDHQLVNDIFEDSYQRFKKIVEDLIKTQ